MLCGSKIANVIPSKMCNTIITLGALFTNANEMEKNCSRVYQVEWILIPSKFLVPLFLIFFFSFFLSVTTFTKAIGNVFSAKSSTKTRPLRWQNPAFIENRRCVCNRTFSKTAQLITHMNKTYNIALQPRMVGNTRKTNPFTSKIYCFVQKEEEAQRCFIGCPSCWFHCPTEDLQRMQRHIKEIHIDGMSERNEPPEEGEYIMDEDVEMG
jgi:hypothetical protein